MIAKPVSLINESDIAALITNGVAETVTLEYKRDLPGNRDEDKREFLADISAFANTQGGDVIYGIDETDGVPTAIVGVNPPDWDQELLRLESILRDGLDPRINAILRRIEADTKSVLLVRVESSLNAPHRVIFRSHEKFYARHSSGKYSLDTAQLRGAFLGTADRFRRIQDFRIDRTLSIARGHTPVPVPAGAALVLHCIPVASFLGQEKYNVLPYASNPCRLLRDPAGLRGTINFEGVVVHDVQTPAGAYTQIFRHGSIEAVETTLANAEHENKQILPSQAIERALITYVPQCLQVISKLGAAPPVAVSVALLGIRGKQLAVPGAFTTLSSPLNRDSLLLPDVLVQSFTDPADVLLKPILDMLWNAFGYEGSPYFENGRFRG